MPVSSTPDSTLRLSEEREAIYSRGRILTADGSERDVWPVGLTRGRGELLKSLVQRESARRALETGFAYAMSASFLLEGLLENAAGNADDQRDVLLTSIDPFAHAHWGNAGRLQLERAGVADRHQLICAPSESALPALVAAGEKFDFAFIDGDHRFEHVFLDIFFARRLLGNARLIVVDDAWMPSVQKACAFFQTAGLCVREDLGESQDARKLIALRVDPRGDARPWDQFIEF